LSFNVLLIRAFQFTHLARFAAAGGKRKERVRGHLALRQEGWPPSCTSSITGKLKCLLLICPGLVESGVARGSQPLDGVRGVLASLLLLPLKAGQEENRKALLICQLENIFSTCYI